MYNNVQYAFTVSGLQKIKSSSHTQKSPFPVLRYRRVFGEKTLVQCCHRVKQVLKHEVCK